MESVLGILIVKYSLLRPLSWRKICFHKYVKRIIRHDRLRIKMDSSSILLHVILQPREIDCFEVGIFC